MPTTIRARITAAIGLLAFTIALMAGGIFYVLSNRRMLAVAGGYLDSQLSMRKADFEARVEELIRDVRLMGRTPPIQGLVRAQRTAGVDPLDGSTEKAWKQRLVILFGELLANKPNYLRARYLRLDDERYEEIVHVQRPGTGAKVREVAALSTPAVDDPRAREVLARRPNAVFVSDLYRPAESSPDGRESPALWAAVAVYDSDQGRPFGVVIIDLDAGPLVDVLGTSGSDRQRQYVTNAEGRYVWYDDGTVAVPSSDAWPPAVRDFPRVPAVLAGADDGRASISGDWLVGLRRIRLGTDADAPAVALIMQAPLSNFTLNNQQVWRELAVMLGAMTIVAVIAGLVLAHQAVRPMIELARAVTAMDVEQRNLVRPVGLTGEAARLADTLEHAIETLRANDRLEASNRELRQFAYVASHDLQEPIRNIQSFADVLTEDHGDRLDDDGREALGFIRRASQRMQALVRDLLEHSRLGRDSARTDGDLDAIVAGALEDLGPQIEAAGATILVGPLGRMPVFAAEVRVLFQNLISNAVKFYDGDEAVRIRIRAEALVDGARFWVCDNGPGIPSDQRETVFMMFRRLHRNPSVEGTGIGLANCRKIVEMHGGRIRVTDSVDGGACFEFDLRVS